MKVLWFGCMEEVVCNRYDLLLHPLFNFETMKGSKYWRDVKLFESVGISTCMSIMNMLKALNLSDG